MINKQKFTLFLVISLIIQGSNVSAQLTSRDLIGTYTLSHFMHTQRLILNDSGKFVLHDTTDIFQRTATGMWALKKRTIIFTPVIAGGHDTIPPLPLPKIKVGKENKLVYEVERDNGKTFWPKSMTKNEWRKYMTFTKER